MPKIISYTPSWLTRPSPGFHLFSTSIDGHDGRELNHQTNGESNPRNSIGPKRTIARRGTEVFAVVDNQIRWSDLCMLKEGWEELQEPKKRKAKSSRDRTNRESVEENTTKPNFRVLKSPGSEQIQQLSISPNGSFLAILTSHTVHVAILPDPTHLEQPDRDPIKLKAFTVGPTTHVLSQSRVVRALWHPCGVSGSCLITVTEDAVVRLWELNIMNRWSFDSPSVAIDLKKLQLGNSEEDDFVPNRTEQNKGFSSDMVGMEVVSACFGGFNASKESAWSSMTLWIAMKDGDVYALCPLLPSKWQSSQKSITALSTTLVSQSRLPEDREDSAQGELRCQREQYLWISDIDGQDPVKISEGNEFGPQVEVYNRPSQPGPIPRLQGPFQIYNDDSEEDLELADIHVIAAKVDAEELLIGEDYDSDVETSTENGLSTSIICLMTRSGRIHMCLDLDGVEGEWLPQKKLSQALPFKESYLVPLEVLDTLDTDIPHEEWPTFSLDVYSRYSFFVTHSKGVYFFSLETWLHNLEAELQNNSGAGATFRINVFRNGPGTLRERVLQFDKDNRHSWASDPTACLVFQDSDLGYFLLTSAGGQPHAITFDKPNLGFSEPFPAKEDDIHPDPSLLDFDPPREAYQPPASLWAQPSLSTFFTKNISNRYKKTMKDEIRLSPATMDLMTEAHRVLSQETKQLGAAAADLFRRCDRLQDELRDQIKRANEAANKIEDIIGHDGDDYGVTSLPSQRSADLEKRIQAAIGRQEKLLDRQENLRMKVSQLGGNKLSKNEELWASEIEKINDSLMGSEEKDDENIGKEPLKPWRRFNEAKDLSEDLVSRAKEVEEERLSNKDNDNSKDQFRISRDIRKAKVEHVQSLLERETALVDAAMSRLKLLSLSSVT